MMHKRDLSRDPLEESSDFATQQLISDIQTIYEEANPPDNLSWTAFKLSQARRNVFSQQKHQRTWLRPPRWFPKPMVFIPGLLLVVLLLSAAGYALSPLLRNLFTSNQGLQQILEQGLLTEVNQTQTSNGFRITVQNAYADSNVVLVGYVIQAPDDRPSPSLLFLKDQTVITADGKRLSPLGAALSNAQDGQGAEVAYFDAAHVGNVKELKFQFQVRALTVESGKENKGQTVHGSWNFSVKVPFHKGRSALLKQERTVNGRTLILEKVVVSNVETRVYIRGIKYDEADGKLTVDNWVSGNQDGLVKSLWQAENGSTVISFAGSLISKHGQWTLTLLSIKGFGKSGPIVEGKPWVFHFNIP